MQIESGAWFTRLEVCKALKVSPTTLWRREKNGVLEPVVFGDTKRYQGSTVLKASKSMMKT